MIHAFNDEPGDALALASLLKPFPSKVNLIPLNLDPAFPPDLCPSSPERVQDFVDCLRSAGLPPRSAPPEVRTSLLPAAS